MEVSGNRRAEKLSEVFEISAEVFVKCLSELFEISAEIFSKCPYKVSKFSILLRIWKSCGFFLSAIENFCIFWIFSQ